MQLSTSEPGRSYIPARWASSAATAAAGRGGGRARFDPDHSLFRIFYRVFHLRRTAERGRERERERERERSREGVSVNGYICVSRLRHAIIAQGQCLYVSGHAPSIKSSAMLQSLAQISRASTISFTFPARSTYSSSCWAIEGPIGFSLIQLRVLLSETGQSLQR